MASANNSTADSNTSPEERSPISDHQEDDAYESSYRRAFLRERTMLMRQVIFLREENEMLREILLRKRQEVEMKARMIQQELNLRRRARDSTQGSASNSTEQDISDNDQRSDNSVLAEYQRQG